MNVSESDKREISKLREEKFQSLIDVDFIILKVLLAADTFITISSFVGISKQEAGIYKFGLNSLGVKPEECVSIDDKDINVKAAEKIGFKGLYLDRKKEDLQALLKRIGV